MAAKKRNHLAETVAKIGSEEPNIEGKGDSGLEVISNLARLHYRQTMRVAALTDAIAEAKEELRRIEEDDLPMAMMELNIQKFETTEGLIVSRESAFQASIAVDNREAAYQWLIDHEFGGLLKLDVSVTFGRGQIDDAMQLADELRERDGEMDVEVNQSIHAQTLKAFVKERMTDTEEDAPEFPADLFGARAYTVAKIKVPKNFGGV